MTLEALDERCIGDSGPSFPELVVSLGHAGATCILTLRGELRARTVKVLEAQFDRLGTTSCHRVVVEACELSHVDDVGIRVLTGLHHYVEARGGSFEIRGARPSIARALACD